jgi:hypothetical protein
MFAVTPSTDEFSEKVTHMDPFEHHTQGLESPATRMVEITPDDASDLTVVTRAITVEVAGHLQIVTAGGDVGRIFVAAGIPFPIRVRRVLATGTTAGGIVGLA